MKNVVFDLLEESLSNNVLGYAVTYKNKDGAVYTTYSEPSSDCTYYELLGMATQLKDDVLRSISQPFADNDDDEKEE